MTSAKRVFAAASLLCLATVLPAPARAVESEQTSVSSQTTSELGPQNRESFSKGYDLFKKQRYSEAGNHFYEFLSVNSPDAADYEWAMFFLGISLYQCKFSHAAADVLAHILTRKPNSRIVSYSLEILEDITKTKPYDKELILLNVLCDHEYDFVEDDTADFVHFYQGLYDWEHGFRAWGNQHFEKIQEESIYRVQYEYQKALYGIYANRLEESIRTLKRLLLLGVGNHDFLDDVRVTLARVLFENGAFEEAISVYRSVEQPMVEQAGYLLEQAWNQYKKGAVEEAMGLLYAFQSPLFQKHFTPEYYVLKSLIYKDACHYQKALGVVDEFRSHYDDSLSKIYSRKEAADDGALLDLIAQRKNIREKLAFYQLLQSEEGRVLSVNGNKLKKFLARLYRLKKEEIEGNIKKEIEKMFVDISDRLLKYEEEAHLIEYEIGLDMYQRISQEHYRSEPTREISQGERFVTYRFQGEFWNDELDDYRVVLPNRCEAVEEWDVYFK